MHQAERAGGRGEGEGCPGDPARLQFNSAFKPHQENTTQRYMILKDKN